MNIIFNEDAYEQTLMDLFSDLGYTCLCGYEMDRDYYNPLFQEQFELSISKINDNKNPEAIKTAIAKLKDFGIGSLEEKNNKFTDYLQNGVSVSYLEDGEERSTIIDLIDYENIENNDFTAINQWTVIDRETKRPDIIIFVNGLPLVVCELKSPSREETDSSEAYNQLKNYMDKIPSLFTYNAFCVMSDMATSKAGTITADENRFMKWKTTDGSYEDTQYAKYDTFFEGIFEKHRFIDLLKNFTIFTKDSIKILAAYHQYFAVNKAVKSTLKAIESDHKAGVFWHTQGSGKSLSMVFYVNKLQHILNSPTFVVITDRNDLDNQLFSQFSKCSDFLRQIPKQATSRENLIELLNNRQANGIFFTTMQKFEESDEPLTTREDVIVISDEAHRSQYGLEEKVDKEGNIKIGAARKIRDALPNATYIGFTGTPISTRDKSTRAVFGNYIDIYDMTQSVEDGATVPIHYESRVIKLNLDKEVLDKIDKEYDKLANEASEHDIEKSKQELSQMEVLLGSPETIDSLVNDIIYHYKNNREFELTGKAMIVAYSRNIAMKIYKRILELEPTWTEKVKVVMTSSNNDPEEWHQIIGTKKDRQELANKFKDDNDSMKIAIVVDMWLTGFDIPSLATMYVFKPMKGHNLMQAIARVNRVFNEKEGGLIVDYIGMSSALRKAMSEYTDRDQKQYGDMDIAKVAYPKFQEKLAICRDLMYGYDYSKFFEDNNRSRADCISGGVNFIKNKTQEEKKQEKDKYEKNKFKNKEKFTEDKFIKESLMLKQSLTLCRSIANENERFEAAFFESVRTILTRIRKKGRLSLKEINERINNLLKQSIKSEGVVNLFSDVKEEVSLFDPDFLAKVASMKEKNLAIELLTKLLNDEIKIYKRTNLVKSELFSEMIKKVMNKYLNDHISNEEVIRELLKIAKEVKQANDEGNDLGLNSEELAFYDALTKPENIKDFYENKDLIVMTQELTESLRRNRTIDWQKKESARANMRSIVKRLLKKYDYPPNEIKNAMDTVLKQCELWADNSI